MTDTLIDDRWAGHGIDAERIREWQAHGFDVVAATAWAHHGIGPVDARAWERAGFAGGDLPSRAALWHHNGFTATEAVAWGGLPGGRSPGAWVFAPSVAVQFRAAGFTPARGWPWWRRGFTAPLAQQWAGAGISVAVAEKWINGGFEDPDVAEEWIGAGLTPVKAALYLRACPNTDDALEWRDRGFDAASIPAWRDAGFTAGDAPYWAARWIRPADAAQWRAAGFCAVEAFMWRAQRIEPAAAHVFVESRTARSAHGGCLDGHSGLIDLAQSGDLVVGGVDFRVDVAESCDDRSQIVPRTQLPVVGNQLIPGSAGGIDQLNGCVSGQRCVVLTGIGGIVAQVGLTVAGIVEHLFDVDDRSGGRVNGHQPDGERLRRACGFALGGRSPIRCHRHGHSGCRDLGGTGDSGRRQGRRSGRDDCRCRRHRGNRCLHARTAGE